MSTLTFHVPCARGTEIAVVHELRALGATDVAEGSGIVSCRGDLALIARANVWLRCASRVLWEIARFEGVETEAHLMDALAGVPFEERLDEKGTFAVDAHLREAPWTHTRYAAQKVKDAIVDRVRAKRGSRPDVDLERPSLRFVLHWERTTATLSLDTSGEPLFQRGYRRGVEGEAPMKETLAASILAIGHADVRRPFIDPCCGTGTLAIEQTWRALQRAPGRDRRFGFERWRDRPPALDAALARARTEARETEQRVLPAPIRLSDWHRDAVSAAERCIAQAGLSAHLVVERVDAREVELPGDQPIVCANLPFGARLAKNRLQLEGFYRTLGERLGRTAGARILLFSAYPRARTLLDLDVVAPRGRRYRLRSGDLEATLFRWDVPDASRSASP